MEQVACYPQKSCMECTCIRHTELPHTTKLFADFVYHFDRVSSFYSFSPFDPAAYSIASSQVQFSDDRRGALVSALRLQNGDSELLNRLSQPGTVAVVTGQQVGLFSGPAYTVYKALTAVKVARELTAQGIPAVPIFWLATEDHDFAEVNQCWTFDPAHRPQKLSVSDYDAAAVSGRPVGQVTAAHYPVEALRGSLEDFPFGAKLASLVEQSYADGATFGAAFPSLVKRLLPSYELLHIDPMLPAVRELAAPAIRSALSQAPELTQALLERNQELASRGYHAQVHVEDQTSLVFLLDGGRRITLKRKGREYLANGRRYSTEELMERAASLSPNALLRPVMQDSILPTVAYIGGPAELAYLAQSEVIYRRVLGRMPVSVPRSGFTLFDQRSAKLMERYRLRLQDFFHGEEHVREQMASALIPPSLAAAVSDTKASAGAAIDRLRAALAGFDPTLVSALDNNRRKIEYQLSKMDRKIRHETLRRDERASRDGSYLCGLIYPEKHLQERLYTIVPFLARHGLDLVDRIYENIQLDCPDHRLMIV
jgi:bacillithiol biosynthesis cysteine-adding enzyme BshC